METLASILSELHPEVDFSLDHRLIEEGILDSFDIVTLVSEIDDRFGVVIPAQELTPENFASVRTLYNLIVKLKEN